MAGLAVLLCAMGSAVLWMSVLAPSMGRFVGVPLAVGFWRLDRKNQHLSKRQFVWGYGAFTVGVGMFLFFTMDDYLRWRILGDHWTKERLVLEHLAISFVGSVLLGALVRAMSAPAKPLHRA